MRAPILIILICMLLTTGLATAQSPISKPLLGNSIAQHPAAEKIGKQLRLWLRMEINDFRTLWNGHPMYTYTLTNTSAEASSQLEVTTSYVKDKNGPWEDTYVISHMSMAPGASQGPTIQTFPRGTQWIKVEIRQDLKPGKPVVFAKTFAARYAAPVIESVAVKAAKDKIGTKLQTTIRNPTVENFKYDCSIRYLFSDSPKSQPMTQAFAQPLQIPANATITHSIPVPQESSKDYLTVEIRGLYDTIASRKFKKVGRIFTPLGK
jgi:hypothetical protein